MKYKLLKQLANLLNVRHGLATCVALLLSAGSIVSIPTGAFAQRVLLNGSFEDGAPPLDGSGNYTNSCTSPRVVLSGGWGAYVVADDVLGWETAATFTTDICSPGTPVT